MCIIIGSDWKIEFLIKTKLNTYYIDIDNETVEVYCLGRLGINVLYLGGDPVIILDYQRQG